VQTTSLTNLPIGTSIQDDGITVVEGMQFPRGYLSPYFINNPESGSVELENSYVLLYENQISNFHELISLLEKVAEADKPLIIIAGDIQSDPLSLLVTQNMRGIVKVAAVKAHGFGDNRKSTLEDIAIITGGTMISVESGLTLCDVTLDNFGQAKHIRVTKDATTIIGGAGIPADINARIDQVRSLVDSALSEYDRENLRQRVANLVDGLTVVN
jgi:chaperonin GroEL